jgi:hypothetical protein
MNKSALMGRLLALSLCSLASPVNSQPQAQAQRTPMEELNDFIARGGGGGGLSAQRPTTPEPLRPVKAEVSFLEAALFFLTGVEPTDEDSVTDREIILRREPLVAYLVDDPCIVRLRNTNNDSIWQMDFCKITEWRWASGLQAGYVWIGKSNAFCVSWKWNKPENYTDPDFWKIMSTCHSYQLGWGSVVVDHTINIGVFVDKGNRPRNRPRSQERMVASFKYIVTLLTGKSKPY